MGKNRIIRVLQICGRMNRGGAEAMIMNVYRKIKRSQLQFDFVVHTDETGAYDDEIREMGGRIYHAPQYRFINHREYVTWWKKFFKEHKEYHILHSHIRSTASLFFPIAKRNGLKVIIHSHSTSNGKGTCAILKMVLQYPLRYQADYFFACSRESGKWLFGKKIINDKNYITFNNAIDIENYSFNPLTRKKIREELGIEDTMLVFGHIGRFHESKNHLFLLDVFAKIHQKREKVKLLLIGDGELRNIIEKKIETLGLRKSIILLGMRKDVNDLLQAMDVFLFPSKWEGLPVTVIEAQAAGVPCFISEKITKEVQVSDLVKSIPINRGIGPWLDAMNQSDFSRKDVRRQIIEAGFDVRDTANWLMSFYLRLNDE